MEPFSMFSCDYPRYNDQILTMQDLQNRWLVTVFSGHLQHNDCSEKFFVSQKDDTSTFERRIGQCYFILWAVNKFSSNSRPEHPRVTFSLCWVPHDCGMDEFMHSKTSFGWENLCVCQFHQKYRDDLKKAADEPNIVSQVTAAAALLNMLNL